MSPQSVLIGGQWRPSQSSGTFRADNPATAQPLDEVYPVSSWADVDAALAAAQAAFGPLRELPAERIADFLEQYAARIESGAEALVAMAHAETALPVKPRLADVELPRTTAQLREAARAARSGSWLLPTIDTKLNIRSCHAPLGPVWVFRPEQFPLRVQQHLGRRLCRCDRQRQPGDWQSQHFASRHDAAAGRMLRTKRPREAGLPPGSVQLIYRTSHADGERAVADPRTAATGYTGSRTAGLALKAAADRAGKPIYLELSSVNPVVVLPQAHRQPRRAACRGVYDQLPDGNRPVLHEPRAGDRAGRRTRPRRSSTPCVEKFQQAPVGTLLSRGVAESLAANVGKLVAGGREAAGRRHAGGGTGFSYANSLLRTSGEEFLARPELFQTEAFGNASLFVVAANGRAGGADHRGAGGQSDRHDLLGHRGRRR